MVSRVARGQVMLAFAHVYRLALFVAVTSLLGRNLRPDDFAFVALVAGMFVVAMEILDFGTTAVVTRDIAARPQSEAQDLARLLFLRRRVGAVLGLIVAGVACSSLATGTPQRVALLAAALGVGLLHLHAYQIVFQVRQAFGPMIALALAAQTAYVLASALLLKTGAGGATIVLLIALRESLLALGARGLARRHLGRLPRIGAAEARPAALLESGWMLGVAGVCYRLTVYGGIFWLYRPASPLNLARFSAAHRLLIPAVDLAWLVAGPLFASMSSALAHSRRAYRVQIEGYAKLLFGLSGVVAVAIGMLAPSGLRLLYGPVYGGGALSAVTPLRWLALGGAFAWVTPVFVVAETTTAGQGRALMVLGLLCLALSALGSVWAVPRFGAEGAAAVLCLCEAFVFVSLLVRSVLRGEIRLGRAWIAYAAPAIVLWSLLGLFREQPGWQWPIAAAWLPLTLVLLARLPAQRLSRTSLKRVGARCDAQAAGGGPASDPSPQQATP